MAVSAGSSLGRAWVYHESPRPTSGAFEEETSSAAIVGPSEAHE